MLLTENLIKDSYMKFTDWINKHYPSFEDKLSACHQELISAGAVVDIDYSNSILAEGTNKGSSVKTYSNKSKGRCRVYINKKDYRGDEFPHVVFINLRKTFQDEGTGKAVPSVINTTTVLFNIYKDKKELNLVLNPKIKLKEPCQIPSREVLVNEQRQWISKLSVCSQTRFSQYFKGKGLSFSDLQGGDLELRMGYSARYGKFCAVPMRYPNDESFEGFQRIFDTGEKIMIRDFNPNGLCVYFSPNAKQEEGGKVAIVLHEGVANAFMAKKMSDELNVNVVNLACLYASNIALVAQIIAEEVTFDRIGCLYDRDLNQVGEQAANAAKNIIPSMVLATTSRNDLCDTVRDYGYSYALREFKGILKKI